MPKNKRILAVLAMTVFFGILVFAGGPKSRIKSSESPYVPGEVLVKFKKGVAANTIRQLAVQKSLEVKKSFARLSKRRGQEYALLGSTAKLDTEEIINKLSGLPQVETVTPNFLRYAAATPNDANFSSLWGMHNTGQTGGTADADIDAPEAWDVSTGSAGVIVAVIDSGIDYNHPDLAANIWANPGEVAGNGVDDDGNGIIDDVHGYDAANDDSDPMDDNGHGTHCAGTVGAVGNNSSGVAGVNWNVRVMALKFLTAAGSGSDADAIECIDYIIYEKQNHGQNVVAINASWGGTGGGDSGLLRDAIEDANDAGIVFCAAAGNGGSDGVGDNNETTHHYPSDYTLPGIISVMATDHNDAKTDFSNYGTTSVDLAAPGQSVLSTVPGIYRAQSGDIFFDDVESGAGNWVTSGTNNSWGITTDQEIFENPSFPVPSPTHFWSDRPGADYQSNTDSYLTYNADINLSSYAGQTIYFGIGVAAYVEDYWDHAYVQFSSNGGSTWATIADFTGFANYWGYYAWEIPESYKVANFRMRFRFTADGSVEYDGWLIDNIGIGTSLTYSYESWGGTSMACPHVAGAVGLMASVFPAETVAERKARILDNVDVKGGLSTYCVTSGRLNLYNSISDGLVTDSITVTSPNGGESWTAGSSQTITWTSSGTVGNVDILYSYNGGSSWNSVIADTANDGSYTWTVPDTPSTNCYVQVLDHADANPSDSSDAVFTITTVPATITVTSPNGGESWTAGSSQTITWTSSGTVGNVDILYSYNGGSSWNSVIADTANDGSYTWTVPDTPSTNCYVQVLDHADGIPSDANDAVFTIATVPATITVTSPNGGESWAPGSSHEITWTSTGSISNVDILYSYNDGASWPSVASYTENDGSFTWTVPDTPSTHCFVRVQDNDGDPGDASDAAFTITASGAETVSTPNTPSGSSSGGIGVSLDFTTGGSTSSLGHDIQYLFDWDDGSDSGWLAVGTTQASHSWAAAGTYNIRAMARCATHTTIESAWSGTRAVTISDGTTSTYYNSPAQYKVLPEVIWAPASGGGTWMSEVQVTDISGGSVVSVYYNTATGRRGPFVLWSNTGGALRSAKFANLLQTIDGLDAEAFTYYGTVGAVEFITQDGSHAIQAAARTLNGNYSKTFTALSLHDANTVDASRSMVIANLTNNASYRSTCGFFNPTGDAVTLELRLRNSTNGQVGATITKTLAGHEFTAFSPFTEAGVPYPGTASDNVALMVEATSGTGSVMCFGASANNKSNDPAAHVAVQNSGGYDNGPGSLQVLPEAIWAPASGGGMWMSEAQIVDMTGGSQVSVWFDYGGGLRRGPIALWTGGAAGSKVKYANLLQSIGAIDTGLDYYGRVGTVEFATQDGTHVIMVTARTLNGNYSKTFPGLRVEEAETAEVGRAMLIQNYSNNATYRSTCGFYNPTSESVTVEFTLLNSSGAAIGSAFSKTFAGYDFQAFSPFNEAGAPYPGTSSDNVILRVQPTSGTGAVMCFGASANNKSNDPASHLAVQAE